MSDRLRLARIRKAVEARDRFLKLHPELRPFQEEIDRRLTHAGSIENRMAVLGFMIHEQSLKFDRTLLHLRERVEGGRSNCVTEDSSFMPMEYFGETGELPRKRGTERSRASAKKCL